MGVKGVLGGQGGGWDIRVGGCVTGQGVAGV